MDRANQRGSPAAAIFDLDTILTPGARDSADPQPAALRLIRELRGAGVRVGIVSSEAAAEAIARRARLADVSDALVGGALVPDLFFKCLNLLGADGPETLAIAAAPEGVRTAAVGGVGLVVGLDRGGDWLTLREHGAAWIVRSFDEISAERIARYFQAREHVRPNVLAAWREVEPQLAGRRLVLFLDYDGTLTPIVERPELATLSGPMRQALLAAAARWPTMIVSGRAREDVAAMVGIERLTYAGSHGLDVAGPPGSNLQLMADPGVVPRIAEATRQLRARTAGIPGVFVEDKKFSVAVHYRQAPEERAADVEAIVDAIVAADPALAKIAGKKVFEVRAAHPWDKGQAVLWLLETLGLNHPDVLPVFIGDDTTDEDAFRALNGRGVGVLVTEIPRPTAARYALQNVDEVGLLLQRLAALGAPSREES